ncbi:MAG: hypothetical protein LBH09_07065 [Peptococcaceae bacterium]|nr:hypothetical protein [Peptococcaceae bacterium]
MERIQLAQEIVNFFQKYELFGNADNMKEDKIERQLDESWFLELLIQTLIEAKYKEGINHNKLSELLSELEKIRLDIECGDYEIF